jgi:RecB family exonuclease
MVSPKMILGSLPELEDALADAVVAARAGDPPAPVTVLAGSVLLGPYLRRALAFRGIAQLNVRYATAHQLAAELAAPGLPPRPRLTPAMERLLVRSVAAGASGYFGGIAGREGFADALLRLFREIDLGSFSPEGFARAASLLDAAGKGEELARLYGDLARRRAGLAATADYYRAAGADNFEGPLFVYGVWAPRELQARLIERIAHVAPVTVFLPVTGTAADGAHEALRQRLAAGGAEGQHLPSPAATSPVARLAGNLFAEERRAIDASGIELVSAPDTVREVWEAARTCMRLAEEGIRFHDMAIVYRQADTYRALVAEIFDEAKIATYIHAGRLVSEHPMGRRVLALLDLAAGGEMRRGEVMEFLTETALPRETSTKYGRFTPAEWDALSREAGIVAGGDQWQARLERLTANLRAESQTEGLEWLADQADRADALRSFIADFQASLAAHAAEGTWAVHLAYLRTLAATYAEGTADVVEALGDLEALATVEPAPSFETFCRAVRDDLESRDQSHVFGEPERHFGREGVTVLDASTLRHLRFRAVYALGIAERAWPPPQRPDPLLLEHEREQINASGEGVLPLRTSPEDEELTFSLVAQAAKDRLVLSYPRSDANRRTKQHIPSYFFVRAASERAGRRLELKDLDGSAVRRISAGRVAHEDLARSLTAAEYDRGLVRGALESSEPAALHALALLTPWVERAVGARRARWGRGLTAHDGVFVKRGAGGPTASEYPVSATRLEKYAHCPYQYFLANELRIGSIPEPETVMRIDHLERGSLIHTILERFLRECGDEAPSVAARERQIPRLLAIAGEEQRACEARGVTGLKLAWTLDKRQIDEDLVRWYEDEIKQSEASTLRPLAFEVGFGGARHGSGGDTSGLTTDEPLGVSAGGRDLRFLGRIDRIDRDPASGRFRVIDYKTGKYRAPARARAPFDGGNALQLPIYLEAAAKALGMEPEQGEAQYYFASSRGGFRRWSIDGADLAARRDEYERILGTIADGIDGGYFAPAPAQQKCMWCDYRDICDARIEPMMERKRSDARGDAYRSLTPGEVADDD